MPPAAAAAQRRRAPARHTAIRWDRLGRVALLSTLVVIVLLYLSPAKHWWAQSGTAGRQRAELRELTKENRSLKRRVHRLSSTDALEEEARKLGMVKQGERAFVIENLPRR
jgi:cell division protein FtsB